MAALNCMGSRATIIVLLSSIPGETMATATESQPPSWPFYTPPEVVDVRGIPTGDTKTESAEDAPLGSRLFDDLYSFAEKARPAGRRLAFVGDNGRSVELRCEDGYPHAQVWVPEARPFAALEPMTAPTNAIVAGTAPVVAPGDSFTARFSLVLTGPDT